MFTCSRYRSADSVNLVRIDRLPNDVIGRWNGVCKFGIPLLILSNALMYIALNLLEVAPKLAFRDRLVGSLAHPHEPRISRTTLRNSPRGRPPTIGLAADNPQPQLQTLYASSGRQCQSASARDKDRPLLPQIVAVIIGLDHKILCR